MLGFHEKSHSVCIALLIIILGPHLCKWALPCRAGLCRTSRHTIPDCHTVLQECHTGLDHARFLVGTHMHMDVVSVNLSIVQQVSSPMLAVVVSYIVFSGYQD